MKFFYFILISLTIGCSPNAHPPIDICSQESLNGLESISATSSLYMMSADAPSVAFELLNSKFRIAEKSKDELKADLRSSLPYKKWYNHAGINEVFGSHTKLSFRTAKDNIKRKVVMFFGEGDSMKVLTYFTDIDTATNMLPTCPNVSIPHLIKQKFDGLEHYSSVEPLLVFRYRTLRLIILHLDENGHEAEWEIPVGFVLHRTP
ncbi:MAG: hypothetical protein AB8F95_19595 [Bacteroidia bacterium]